jgi:hypothetical protein
VAHLDQLASLVIRQRAPCQARILLVERTAEQAQIIADLSRREKNKKITVKSFWRTAEQSPIVVNQGRREKRLL